MPYLPLELSRWLSQITELDNGKDDYVCCGNILQERLLSAVASHHRSCCEGSDGIPAEDFQTDEEICVIGLLPSLHKA